MKRLKCFSRAFRMEVNRTMHSTLLTIFCVALVLSTVYTNDECNKKFQSCRDKIDNKCNKLCVDGVCEIRAAVILPNDTVKHLASLDIVLPLLDEAIKYAREIELIPPWLRVTLISNDDQCEASYAQIATIETYSNKSKVNCNHVIFGPVCDYCVATVSRIVQFYNTPLLTVGGFSNDFDKDKKKCEDEYYMLIRTGLIYSTGLAQFFTKIAFRYKWHKVAFLYDKYGQNQVAGLNTCSFMMQSLAEESKKIMETHSQQFQYKDGDLGLSTFSIEDFLKEDIGVHYGIIVMCADRERIHEILLAAVNLGTMMHKGEYVFFNIELNSAALDLDEPWKDPKYNETNIQKLKIAYQNVVTLTSYVENINDTVSTDIEMKRKYSAGFYDAMMLYLNVLNETMVNGGPDENENVTIDGYSVVCKMFNKTFEGKNGLVEINHNGDRKTRYSSLCYNETIDRFEVFANYAKDEKDFVIVEGKTCKVPNLDTPSCGFNSSKCVGSFPYGFLSIILSVILIGVISLFSYFIHIRRQKENSIYARNWLIKSVDLQLFDKPDDTTDIASVASLLSGLEAQQDLPIYIYKNIKVAAKSINNNSVDLHKHTHWLRLKQMLDLQHDNLIKFYGICEEPTRFVVMEYAPRGSLQNILKNLKINERTSPLITMSFISDIIKGMDYLHGSEIKFHGSLSSTNCVVDSRLMVKITDFGVQFLYDNIGSIEDETYWKKKLWTAPELLREEHAHNEGTQKGDVYSFAIIVHEIVQRKGPFYIGEYGEHGEHCPRTLKDIVETVKNGSSLRPLIDETSGDKEVVDLMRSCWVENPADRPDFSALKNTIRKLNKKHDSANILDNLLSRLEQYANNLETLVEERTADYLEEKRKCEELLYQLLPKSVASQLINGKSVIAETYDQVTIYFSDIVGFTSLSAMSEPLEVVEFLNDLYTCFDSIIENFDVYKVETIGDAYMVVSGLPVRNDKLHAREIARMGLALLKNVYSFQIRHRPNDQLKLRIGMHTGPCVAGVVGLKMPRYCLFGDTVNTASRMESNGAEQKIHVSSTTKELLDYFDCFELETRGEITIKGKGKMITYWLVGEKPPRNQPLLQQSQPQQESSLRKPLEMKTTATNTSVTNSPIHVIGSSVVRSTPSNVGTQIQTKTVDRPKNGNITISKFNNPHFDQNVEDDLSNASSTVPLLSVTSDANSEKDS